jgi:hypothetical protein
MDNNDKPAKAKTGRENMNCKKLEIDGFYKCVRNFSDLGTGRRSKKVLVGDSEDARTSHFSFVANIKENSPSWSEITFTNREIFYLRSETVRGKRAFIFLWNELTEDLWFRQIERTKLLEWRETAKPQDRIAMDELIVGETGSECRICHLPDFAIFNLRQIQLETMKLSLSQLRKLTSLIDLPVSREPAVAAKVA